ncbi:transposase family protein [Nonomuraea sp. NPDC050691]|uniref:transposase family protein n=1 Tax=Nonomuraea sp. NPDC050691 TaxID=3155661 RepID=UPI0033FEBE8A
MIAYLGDSDQTAILDATEIRVRRPAAGTAARDRFVSGRSRINAMKAMVLTDARGAVLYCGQVCAGSIADITQARQSGLVESSRRSAATPLDSAPLPLGPPEKPRAGEERVGRHPANCCSA